MTASDVFREFEVPHPVGLHFCKPELRDAVEHCLAYIFQYQNELGHGGYERAWLKQAYRTMIRIAQTINEQVHFKRCDPSIKPIDTTYNVDHMSRLQASGLA